MEAGKINRWVEEPQLSEFKIHSSLIMPPRKATPGKPRAVSGLELDHPGPAWSAGQGENRRTPAKPSAAADDEQPKTANRAKTPAKSPARAAAPKSPASAAGKRTKTPAKAPASPKAASPAKPAAKSPAKSPKAAAPARAKSPAAKPAAAKTPRASAARAPKPVPESTAQSARKQLNEVGLGDYWTAPSSRRKAAKAEEARAGSPAAARPGDAPPGYEDEDEPIYSVGGGWLVNKILLSCIILTLASAAEQLYRTRSVGARQLGTFAAWGVVSGTVSELWAKALGYATESLEVGTRRTVLTVLVDQLTMSARAAARGAARHAVWPRAAGQPPVLTPRSRRAPRPPLPRRRGPHQSRSWRARSSPSSARARAWGRRPSWPSWGRILSS